MRHWKRQLLINVKLEIGDRVVIIANNSDISRQYVKRIGWIKDISGNSPAFLVTFEHEIACWFFRKSLKKL